MFVAAFFSSSNELREMKMHSQWQQHFERIKAGLGDTASLQNSKAWQPSLVTFLRWAPCIQAGLYKAVQQILKIKTFGCSKVSKIEKEKNVPSSFSCVRCNFLCHFHILCELWALGCNTHFCCWIFLQCALPTSREIMLPLINQD